MHHQTVKTETLYLVYQPEMSEDTEDEFTTDTQRDIGEDSDEDEYSALVLMLSNVSESPADEKDVDPVADKVAHISEEYGAELRHLFQGYTDVIAYSFDDVRSSKCKTTHRFELISNEPIFQNLRRLPPKFKDIMKNEVDRMFNASIITLVESSCTSPIVLFTKKDESPRFCIHIRKLNAVIKLDRWALLLIDEIFDEVKGRIVFSKLDLFQGYWQIKIHESCKAMTTFNCRYGTFQFEVMPLGLSKFRSNVREDDGQKC